MAYGCAKEEFPLCSDLATADTHRPKSASSKTKPLLDSIRPTIDAPCKCILGSESNDSNGQSSESRQFSFPGSTKKLSYVKPLIFHHNNNNNDAMFTATEEGKTHPEIRDGDGNYP